MMVIEEVRELLATDVVGNVVDSAADRSRFRKSEADPGDPIPNHLDRRSIHTIPLSPVEHMC